VEVDVNALDHRWGTAFPDRLPLSYDVRCFDRDRWVRFHSLPASKRCADTAAEYAEIEHRHLAVLHELQAMCKGVGADLLIISASYGDDRTPNRIPKPIPKIARDLPWVLWKSFQEEPDDEVEFWLHAMVAKCSLNDTALGRILRLTADDEIANTIIADTDLRWLYAPYSGGADVLAPSQQERDAIRERHANWLSISPSGL
jgi:hypothetical protein